MNKKHEQALQTLNSVGLSKDEASWMLDLAVRRQAAQNMARKKAQSRMVWQLLLIVIFSGMILLLLNPPV